MAMTFRQWLEGRAIDSDEVGNFAEAVLAYPPPDWPRDSREAWLAYFDSAREPSRVVAAFRMAWVEYDRARRWQAQRSQ